MIVTPLGIGGAFSDRFFHNNYLFQLGDHNLLLDAGTTLRYSLKEAGFHHTQVDSIFITHFHSDHVGGLEELLLRCYWNFSDGKHKPYRPMLIMMESQEELFTQVLRAGLCTSGLDLSDYCEIRIIPNTSAREYTCTINDYELTMIDTSDLHCIDMHSFALKITNLSSGRNLLFTSDIKHIEQSSLRDHINSQTVAIFHDLEPSSEKNAVHASLKQVLNYYPPSVYHKIYAMHVPDQIERFEGELSEHGIKLLQQSKPLTFS